MLPNDAAFPHHNENGILLRDYFATKAMAAYLTSPTTAPVATDRASVCAQWAYIQADAMMKARMQ